MNRKLKPTKFAQQIKDEQIGFMLEEIEQDIEQYKKIIQTKDKQLIDLKHILKAAKNSYQQVTKQKQELKQCISDIYTYKKQKTKTATASILQAEKKYKKVVYQEETDSETEQDQQEVSSFEEIEEQDNDSEQQTEQEQQLDKVSQKNKNKNI